MKHLGVMKDDLVVRSSSVYSAIVVLFCWFSVCSVAYEKANPGDYPFFATLLLRSRPICGVTLFTTNRALTSCYCLMSDPPKVFRVPHHLLDPKRLEVDSGNEADLPTGKSIFGNIVKVHPKCERTDRYMKYDFGVIELMEHFELKPGYTEIIDIFSQGEAVKNSVWESGLCESLDFDVQSDGKHAGVMKKKKLTVQAGQFCVDFFKFNIPWLDFTDNIQACTIVQRDEDYLDCGKPDFGGPMLCPQKGTEKKVFIGPLSGRNNPFCTTSTEKVCEIYSRVDSALDWIRAEFPDPTTSPSPAPPPEPTPAPSPAPSTAPPPGPTTAPSPGPGPYPPSCPTCPTRPTRRPRPRPRRCSQSVDPRYSKTPFLVPLVSFLIQLYF